MDTPNPYPNPFEKIELGEGEILDPWTRYGKNVWIWLKMCELQYMDDVDTAPIPLCFHCHGSRRAQNRPPSHRISSDWHHVTSPAANGFSLEMFSQVSACLRSASSAFHTHTYTRGRATENSPSAIWIIILQRNPNNCVFTLFILHWLKFTLHFLSNATTTKKPWTLLFCPLPAGCIYTLQYSNMIRPYNFSAYCFLLRNSMIRTLYHSHSAILFFIYYLRSAFGVRLAPFHSSLTASAWPPRVAAGPLAPFSPVPLGHPSSHASRHPSAVCRHPERSKWQKYSITME